MVLAKLKSQHKKQETVKGWGAEREHKVGNL